MNDFIFKMPTRIVFGAGQSRDLSAILKEFSAKHILIVTGKNTGKTASFAHMCEGLKACGAAYDIFNDTQPEPPVEAVDQAVSALRKTDYDLVIAFGGGSVIDSAKAISMLLRNEGSARDYLFGGSREIKNRGIPLIGIPTTAGSGSEVTASSVISDPLRGKKLSITHPYLIPTIAVVDPEVQCEMPAKITSSTGMDALTHAIEAYVSKNSEPVSDALAVGAIRMIGEYLPRAYKTPNDMEARSHMAVASVMAAAAFMNGGLGAVHGISQAIGGIAHVSHGLGNALLLPYVCEKNLPGSPEKFAHIAQLLTPHKLGADPSCKPEDCITKIIELNRVLDIPEKLSQVKVTREMFPQILEESLAYRLLPLNPVPMTEQFVMEILNEAF